MTQCVSQREREVAVYVWANEPQILDLVLTLRKESW